MSWEVRVTDAAYQDLREAAAYMRDALGSPKAARDFVGEFESRVSLLETFPEGRPLVADFDLARKGYRWCPVGNFMLFYTADRESLTVMVERLLYGARDWKSIVGDERG